MASALFKKYKVACMSGGSNTDLLTSNVKAVLLDHADDDPDTAAGGDEFLSDIAAGARVSTSGNLTSKAFTSGAFDCADFTLSGVTGDQSESIVFYIDTGTETTSRLVAKIDTGTGLPFTPSGGDVNVVINGSGIFSV